MALLSRTEALRLLLCVECLLFNARLMFLGGVLDALGSRDSQALMHLIFAFSRQLDLTSVVSVVRIHVLNAHFDQVMVVGGVDAEQIRASYDHYYKHVDGLQGDDGADGLHDSGDEDADKNVADAAGDDDDEMDIARRPRLQLLHFKVCDP